jgi:hypothetical protein
MLDLLPADEATRHVELSMMARSSEMVRRADLPAIQPLRLPDEPVPADCETLAAADRQLARTWYSPWTWS